MNFNKKIVAGMLVTALTCTSAMPAFAQTPETICTPNTVMAETTEFNASIPQEVLGMDRFLSNSANGTIYLDMDSALAAGYDANVVSSVKTHLDNINEQVLAGNMVVGENFNAYSTSMVQSSIAPRGGSASYSSDYGYSGYISTWFGDVYVFYNALETTWLIQAFAATTATCNSIINKLAELKDTPGMSLDDAEHINTAMDLTIVGAGIVGQTSVLQRYAVQAATTSGDDGITWYIHQNFNTGAYTWAFDGQDHADIADLVETYGS